jgi:hypothetical protein
MEPTTKQAERPYTDNPSLVDRVRRKQRRAPTTWVPLKETATSQVVRADRTRLPEPEPGPVPFTRAVALVLPGIQSARGAGERDFRRGPHIAQHPSLPPLGLGTQSTFSADEWTSTKLRGTVHEHDQGATSSRSERRQASATASRVCKAARLVLKHDKNGDGPSAWASLQEATEKQEPAPGAEPGGEAAGGGGEEKAALARVAALAALMGAAKEGEIKQLEEALVSGVVGIDAVDERGATALYVATMYGKPAAVAVLLKAGAEVDKENNNGVSPLMAAARDGYTGIVNQLLAAGADFTQVDEFGRTATTIAGEKNHPETAQAVMDFAAANPAPEKKAEGVAPEPVAVEEVEEKSPSVLEPLLLLLDGAIGSVTPLLQGSTEAKHRAYRSRLHTYRSMVCARLGQMERAAADMEEALLLNGNDVIALRFEAKLRESMANGLQHDPSRFVPTCISHGRYLDQAGLTVDVEQALQDTVRRVRRDRPYAVFTGRGKTQHISGKSWPADDVVYAARSQP